MTSAIQSSSAARHAGASDSKAALRAWLRLLACSNMIERTIRTRLREEFGMTLPRFDVLAQLDAAARDGVQGLTMSALSDRLMVTNGNLTALVERLVQEGLVSRVVSPDDRRISIVRLTPAGKRSLDTMAPRHEAWIKALFADLSTPERTQLYELLGKLKSSLQQQVENEGTLS